MSRRPPVSLLLVLMALPSRVRAEPRELLFEDTPIGAIAVTPPPEWVPDTERPDQMNAWLTHDGPWIRSLMPYGGRERPSGQPTTLTLGRTIESVPTPPASTLRPQSLTLETPGGHRIAEFRCPTTEVLGETDDGWHVRLYREGPSGERYVLDGLTAERPTPGDCTARVAWVDTGLIPSDWVRVPKDLPAFTARAFWWKRDATCVRFVLVGDELVGRSTSREDGCRQVTTERFRVTRSPDGITLSEPRNETVSSCGGGTFGMGGSGSITTHRVVAVDRFAWRWLIQRPSQAPIAYHPDDAGAWYKTRAACEASQRAR